MQDGEVEEFMRLPLPAVVGRLGHEFKDNCNLVIAHFLLRHGALTPDMPGYLQLVSGLAAGDTS